MPPMHRIYLKGPWNYVLVSPSDSGDRDCPVPPTALRDGKARLPAAWQTLFGDWRGLVRWERRFHRPTNLDADELVWLAFEGVGGEGEITLNGQFLGLLRSDSAPQRFEMTRYLRGDELLLVDLKFTGPLGDGFPGGLYGPVALEIVRGE